MVAFDFQFSVEFNWPKLMYFDYSNYRKSVIQFIQSPDGYNLLKQILPGPLVGIIFALVALFFSFLAIFTIIWTKAGLETFFGLLKVIFTGEVFEDTRKTIQNEPKRLFPMLTIGIIIGPQGHGAVLGSFSPSDQKNFRLLREVAKELANLYTNGPKAPNEQAMYDVMKNDTFIPDRRRFVLEPFARGRKLVMFDVEQNVDETACSNDIVYSSFLVTNNDTPEEIKKQKLTKPPKGSIIQLPWSSAEQHFVTNKPE